MMKAIFLAGSMIVASPALAQDATHSGHTMPQTAPAQPTTGTAATQAPVRPTTTTPSTAPAPATTAPAPQPEPSPTPVPEGTAPETAAATAPSHTQVAQVVDQQFGSYDKNGDGQLDKAEFAAWMDALKAQANVSEPAASRTAWNDAAFKQADGDKSASVTKTELTGFLVKGAAGQS